MSDAIIWLDQAEAHDVQLCGVKVVNITRLGAEPVGFVIAARAVAKLQREGNVNDALSADILLAYHRLIVFGGNYMPFVEISASPLAADSSEPITAAPQLGGTTVIATIEEMVRTNPSILFALLVQLVQPSNQFEAESASMPS